MKTIFIRLKSLVIFGMILLSITFFWLGLGEWQKYRNNVTEQEKAVQSADTLTLTEPMVTIVAEEESTGKDDFFSEYRLQRERTRSEQLEILREVVSNPNSSAQVRQQAQLKLIEIADNLEKVSKTENTLIAKGFRDAIVVMQEQAVMVILPSEGLRQDEIARVADMVVKIMGCKLEDVVIVPKTP